MSTNIKQQLINNLTEWQARIESKKDVAFWFSDAFNTAATTLNTELESQTQGLVDVIKASEERNTIVENINFLRNLLISWKEGLYRNVVTNAHLETLKARWSEKIHVTLELLGLIVEQLPQSVEVEFEESAIPVGQKTLFTTAAKQRRRDVDQNGDFDGAVFLSDAEDILTEWTDSRRKLPSALAKNAQEVVTCRSPIIPKFEPYVSADMLNGLGFKSQQLGTYTILHDQILVGLHMKWMREKNLSKHERNVLLVDAVSKLGDKYGRTMLLAHEKGLAAQQNGYQFFWVISEQHLSTIRQELEASPVDWGLV